MRKANALTARFNGGLHPVCCHGCLAVLHAVERNKLVDEYLQNKASLHLAG
ncbi:heavy metal translocating P-type ATPase metal-binding domain-containing protein [Undibacterium sp. TS12]|nr:heavy metal translocating P-type ATPase metal-binding domain-containing protein [Undibacterium sp. TS12]